MEIDHTNELPEHNETGVDQTSFQPEEPAPWTQAGLTFDQWNAQKMRENAELIARLRSTLNWMEHPNDPQNKRS